MRIKILRILICLSFFFVPEVYADQYPSKVITIVVPFSAGGPADVLARLLARPMGASLKTQVIIENVTGAGSTIGANRVAKAPPDGYTLLLHNLGHSTAISLYRKLAYHPINDFEPIGLIADIPMTLVTKKDLPPNDLKELLAYVKTHRQKINLANAGPGSSAHFCGMLFQTAIQTELTTIPYAGTAPAMIDLLGGQVDILCDQVNNTISQVKAGKIKIIGVTTKKRLPALPNVPSLHEAGLPNFEITVWNGLYAPKGTPKEIIKMLSLALQESLRDAALKQRCAELGVEVMTESSATPEALRAHLKAEIEKWAPIIKKAGVYAD
jgi:tripartite-type tricarboxylate transporter receptor subunit TctC